MPYLFIIIYIMLIATVAEAKKIDVCASCPFTTLQEAATLAEPGDSIVLNGIFNNPSNFISNLKGTADSWITITSSTGERAAFIGGSAAFQLSDAAYIKISNLDFSAQTGNGVNIDDGGTYDTPAHHVIFEDCTWSDMDATGNNDMLKLSGLDSFSIINCKFTNGSEGGSGIDMVGCHAGTILSCSFFEQGSNSIQAKGGSSSIVIEKNYFFHGGQRDINIGGSTGKQFFRPLGADYEAKDLGIYLNQFVNSFAPLAFVGAVQCEAVNNVIFKPGKWAIRILQENIDGMQQCANNKILNNIFSLDAKSANPTINIGPNTNPGSFIFSNNIWFNNDNPAWQGPNLPVNETSGYINIDPMLIDSGGYILVAKGSPVGGKGRDVPFPKKDFYGNDFRSPLSVGIIEVNNLTSVEQDHNNLSSEIGIFPNPNYGCFILRIPEGCELIRSIQIIDNSGQVLNRYDCKDLLPGLNEIAIDTNANGKHIQLGFYLLKLCTAHNFAVIPLIIL